jgi:transmembrane sensor
VNTQSYTAEQRRQAAEWFVRIHDVEDPSPLLLLSWMQWLKADDAHRRAFEAVERAWHQAPDELHIESFADESVEQDDDYDGSISVAEWRRRKESQNAPKKASRSLRAGWFALAASVLAAAGIGWWAMETYQPFARPSSGEFATSTGEHREIILADGSRVTLGAQTTLSIDFTDDSRTLRLHGGEAFFSVKKDTARPFRVHALDGVITAVGTAFNVRTSGDRVTVAVTEGVVAVAESGATQEVASIEPVQAKRLEKGEQLTFTVHSEQQLQTLALTRVDPEQPIRWREGWLVYRQEPLRDVLRDVARYSEMKIEVSQELDDHLRYTGAVNTSNVDEWIAALPEVFPIHIETNSRFLKVTGTPGGDDRML